MTDILLLHGPNLNLLGHREPAIYGDTTLDHINDRLIAEAERGGLSLRCLQSNAEHKLIEAVHEAPADGVRMIIINPAGFTHTSVALRDALLGVALPFIEVHLSNVYAREAFRERSFFSDVAVGVITGLGDIGYDCALAAAMRVLETHNSNE